MVAGSAHDPPGRGSAADGPAHGVPHEGWVDDRALGEALSGPEQPHVSPPLARRLREAGLGWTPANGDRFVIPDRDLDEHVFLVSPMSVEVRQSPAGLLLTFNGAVEWALDAIVVGEAVWLPSEGQARERLGEAFAGLEAHEEGHRCTVATAAGRAGFDAPDPADAYALALLHLLGEPHPAEDAGAAGRHAAGAAGRRAQGDPVMPSPKGLREGSPASGTRSWVGLARQIRSSGMRRSSA